MANNNGYDDHPLDSLLDEESQEEFGLPNVRENSAGPEEDVNGNLKNWSAEDFASMYVRFQPHLIRHAKRYLTNPVQAEEVVQDAFLYLMTTLPELDSELGVLKFLKWKVKMLSYDILRSSTMRRERPLPDSYEAIEVPDSTTAAIDRAEDNAVISLALASLNPRQREAIVASVYEEKSAEEVGYQLGLSSNAARQLIHRAKASFRKALIGEAEVRGKSVSEILSVAAKKAASDAQRHASKVGVLAGLLIVGSGSIGIVGSNYNEQSGISSPVVIAMPGQELPSERIPAEPGGSEGLTILQDAQEPSPIGAPPATETDPDATLTPRPTEGENSTPLVENEQVLSAEGSLDSLKPVANLPADGFKSILTTNVLQAGFYPDSYSAAFSDTFSGTSIEVFGGTGISAFLDLDPKNMEVREIVFQMWIEGRRYMGIAKSNNQEIVMNDSSVTLTIKSKEFYVIDDNENVFSDSPLAAASSEVVLMLSEKGHPLSASMTVFG